jgi:hypothetical protein
MSKPRYHLEDKIDKIPQVKEGLAAACALLIATNSADLECDLRIAGKQFHIEIYAIPHCQDKNRPTLRMNSAIQQMDVHHD